MKVKILEENSDVLPEYENISIAFQVKTYLRVEIPDNGFEGIKLIEEAVETPFVKNYDEITEEKPSGWIKRFDLSNWGILSAFDGDKRIGGAAIVWKTPEVFMLEGREDLACLWDLRVSPDYRGVGIGHQLFDIALKWAKARNCRLFKVETQNINVPACKFYIRQGCVIGAINRYAYPEVMNEIQLVWCRNV
jgi:ribosomal protein S18 acetylase RimI-like enzyme